MDEAHTPLSALIDDLQRNPVSAARAGKGGKFPMAAMKPSADGATLDMVPLEYAMTAESFERIRALIDAIGSQRSLIAAAPAMLDMLHWAITAVDRLAAVTPAGLLRTGIRAKADECRALIALAEGRPEAQAEER